LNGKKPVPQDYNELADAASADSLVARRFELDVDRFKKGDRSGAAALKATLTSWCNNHDRFAESLRETRPLRPRCRSRPTYPHLLRSAWMPWLRSKAEKL
jgi:hypothetical protein